jgi:hypothetical protein
MQPMSLAFKFLLIPLSYGITYFFVWVGVFAGTISGDEGTRRTIIGSFILWLLGVVPVLLGFAWLILPGPFALRIGGFCLMTGGIGVLVYCARDLISSVFVCFER